MEIQIGGIYARESNAEKIVCVIIKTAKLDANVLKAAMWMYLNTVGVWKADKHILYE